MGQEHLVCKVFRFVGRRSAVCIRCVRNALPSGRFFFAAASQFSLPLVKTSHMVLLRHRVAAFAGKFAVWILGPLLIKLGLGTSEVIPPRGKLHIIPSPLEGRDWWYMA